MMEFLKDEPPKADPRVILAECLSCTVTIADSIRIMNHIKIKQ